MVAVKGSPPTHFEGDKIELNLQLLEGMVKRGQTPPRKQVDDLIRGVEGQITKLLDPENRWDTFWDGICELGLRGGIDELAAGRGSLEQTWEQSRWLTAHLLGVTQRLQAVARKPVRGEELLGPVLEEHDRFQRDVLRRWQTREDLEGILVEHAPLSHGRLADWVKNNPPPQAWYDQDDDPFAPAE